MSGPRVLVVGAGAVGQAYALALSRGGAAVHFFVKPHHDARLAEGMPIREVGMFATGPLNDLAHLPRLTDWAKVEAQEWHSIWLAVDSTALKGDWVRALARGRGDATVVVFQTGTSGRAHLRALLPAHSTVAAMIPFLAWWTPLDDTHPAPDGPHMAVWHPPLMATPLSGPTGRVHDIAGLLQAGGLGSRIVGDAAVQGAMGSAILLPTIAGLEVAGWSLSAFRGSTSLRTVLTAIHEARAITAAVHHTRPGPGAMLKPLVFRLATRIAPALAPLDLETYLRVHFTKVGAQTLASLSDLVTTAKTHNLPSDALAQLQGHLRTRRAP